MTARPDQTDPGADAPRVPDPAAMDDPQMVAVAIQSAVEALDQLDPSGGLRADLDGMLAGETIAQQRGLTQGDLDLLYAEGFKRLMAGDARRARDILGVLATIDPLEARNHYALAVAMQQLGHAAQAEQVLITFLSLDATNPDGYLRLGECLFAQARPAQAREAFELALAEAEKAGAAPQAELARSQLLRLDHETDTTGQGA
ncbi:MAG: hypothetical protein ACU0BF_00810 [Paracoccaceae bacterium]